MNECSKIEKLLWEYPDGEISPAEKNEVSAHLDECAVCRRALETIEAIRESKKADRAAISSIDAFAFDNAVMSKIRGETKGSEAKTEDRGYTFRMAVSFGLAAAIVIFLMLSISDLADLTLHRDWGGKQAEVAEKKYDRIDIHLRPPESEIKPEMAPMRIAGKKDQTPESFSLLPAPVSRPAPDSVNIDAVYLTDETVPVTSQQTRAMLSDVVVDTGIIQAAETPLSMLVTVEKMPAPVEVVPPEYPVWARKRGLSGVVWVKAKVDENGDIIDAQVLSSSVTGVGFEEAALEAALKSRYTPAEANGIKLPVWIVYPVRFVFASSDR